MSLIVFTGGARSGKSSVAQRLASVRAVDGASVFVVAFGRTSVDDEFAERVNRHRASRPLGWTTIEATTSGGWIDAVPAEALLVVDCLGTLLGRVMEESFAAVSGRDLGGADPLDLPPGVEQRISERFDPVVDWLGGRAADTIVVTNEVGDGVVPIYASGRVFRDVLGRANRMLVDRADLSFLCVAGRLVELSGLPREAGWPAD